MSCGIVFFYQIIVEIISEICDIYEIHQRQYSTYTYNQLLKELNIANIEFASNISSLSPNRQLYEAENGSKLSENVDDLKEIISSKKENLIHSPMVSYIYNNKSNEYYLNLGVESKRLQGFAYRGYKFDESFTDYVHNAELTASGHTTFISLMSECVSKLSIAIKYYDGECGGLGITLNRYHMKERGIEEAKIVCKIYSNSFKYKPLFLSLSLPPKNIIKLIEDWEDNERNWYFMIIEFANCGELLLFVDDYHDIIHKQKKLKIKQIHLINNQYLRDIEISRYQNSLKISLNCNNAYIKLIKYIFVQMVQSIFIFYFFQEISYLDVSSENFILHFNENDQLLVKLVDFGRAIKCRKRDNNNYQYQSEKYHFSLSTYSGKLRFMSPESALFIKYRDAQKCNPSNEDIYNRNRYPNGNKLYKIDNINDDDMKSFLLFKLDLLKKILTPQTPKMNDFKAINKSFIYYNSTKPKFIRSN